MPGKEAGTICRAFIRDIAAVNGFGDGYHAGTRIGMVSIKPSTFGAMLAIECAAILDGVRVDQAEKWARQRGTAARFALKKT